MPWTLSVRNVRSVCLYVRQGKFFFHSAVLWLLAKITYFWNKPPSSKLGSNFSDYTLSSTNLTFLDDLELSDCCEPASSILFNLSSDLALENRASPPPSGTLSHVFSMSLWCKFSLRPFKAFCTSRLSRRSWLNLCWFWVSSSSSISSSSTSSSTSLPPSSPRSHQVVQWPRPYIQR